MKWIELNPKEPDFNERVLFMNEKGEWWDGRLEEITHNSKGKVYVTATGTEGQQFYDAKYFMKIDTPSKPKE